MRGCRAILLALSLIQQAQVLAHGRDDHFESLVLARVTRLLVLADRREEAEELLPSAIELATRAQNLDALSALHGTRVISSAYGPEFEGSYKAAVSAARETNSNEAERNITIIAGFMCLWCGDFDRSRESLLRAGELHERFAPHNRYWEAGYAWLLSLFGEYDEAVERSDTLCSAAQVPTRIVALTARYEVGERRGEPESSAIAEELASIALHTGESQRSIPALAARARQALLAEGVEAATPLFWEALGATTTSRGTGSHWMFSPDLARALADEQGSDQLERWAQALRALTEGDPHPHNQVALTLTEAHLATVMGDPLRAGVLFEEAASGYGALPCPAREAESLLGLADARWRAEDAEESAFAARRALEIAQEIGATALADRAAQVVNRVGHHGSCNGVVHGHR